MSQGSLDIIDEFNDQEFKNTASEESPDKRFLRVSFIIVQRGNWFWSL